MTSQGRKITHVAAVSLATIGTATLIGLGIRPNPTESPTLAYPAGFIFDAGPIKYPTQMYQYMSQRPGFTNKIPVFILKQRPNGEQWLNFLTFDVPLGARKLLIEALHGEPYLAWIPLLEYEYDDSSPRAISVDVNWIPTNRPIFRILYAK